MKVRNQSIGLYIWDWRFRVGFDVALRNKVATVIGEMPNSREKTILGEILDWASGFVSLDALLEALQVGQANEAILAEIRSAQLLHIPQDLRLAIERKLVTAESILSLSGLDAMRQLLTEAMNAPYKQRDIELFGIVFGDALEGLLEIADCQPAIPRPPVTSLNTVELENIVARFPQYVQSEPELRRITVRAPMPEYDVKFQPSNSGYAEYWPRELADTDADQLTINVNCMTKDKDALVSTLLHEVYPGHGLYYELVRTLRPSFVDHGAFGLIEGWATWCDWHAVENSYSAFARAARLRSLRVLRSNTPDAAVAAVNDLLVENGEINTKIERLTLEFQYPSFAASYGLGALWFEQHLTRRNFVDFFVGLSARPWGDFFKLWSG
jgi:hypothetical protein